MAHEVTASTPKAEHVAKANHPGSGAHIVGWVRDLGEVCHGGTITAEQHTEAIKAHQARQTA